MTLQVGFSPDRLVRSLGNGVGRILAGMARQQYDLQLTRYGQEGWRATFYPAGIGHSLTPMVGSAWTRTPWTAVQRAAWEALRRRESEGA